MRNRLVEKAVTTFNEKLARNQANNLCSKHNLELTHCKFPHKVLLFTSKLDFLDCLVHRKKQCLGCHFENLCDEGNYKVERKTNIATPC